MTQTTVSDNQVSNEAKHTPGPWTVSVWHDGRDGTTPCIMASGATVAKIHVAPITPPPEADANARLIAAAPELLAACKLALETVGDMTEAEQRRQIVRKAIAKAEGR